MNTTTEVTLADLFTQLADSIDFHAVLAKHKPTTYAELRELFSGDGTRIFIYDTVEFVDALRASKWDVVAVDAPYHYYASNCDSQEAIEIIEGDVMPCAPHSVTRYQTCAKHAEDLNRRFPFGYDTVDLIEYWGGGGPWKPEAQGCVDGLCRLWLGTDHCTPAYCLEEMKLDFV